MNKKHLSNKHFLLFAILILFILAFTESILVFVTNRKNKELFVSTQSNYQLAQLNSIHAKMVKIHDCVSDNETEQSFYECVIKNYTKKDFTNWQIDIKVNTPVTLKACWNASAVVDGNIISVTPKTDISKTFNKNSVSSFELFLNSNEDIEVESISISGNFINRISQFPLHFIVIILASITLLVIIIYLIIYHYMKKEIDVLNLVTERSNTIIEQTMKTFVNFIDAKDEYTRGHSTRVAEYSKQIAKRMGYDKQFQQDIYYMGLMHDIGKLTVPNSILNKTGRLTADEWAVIQMHTENGVYLLRNFTVIPEIKDAVLYHHERYDGKGYLAQLKGEEIPLCARIICVADSYDAMSTNRCYRLKYTKERIIKEFERCSAKQFDPTIASVMIDLLSDGTI